MPTYLVKKQGKELHYTKLPKGVKIVKAKGKVDMLKKLGFKPSSSKPKKQAKRKRKKKK